MPNSRNKPMVSVCCRRDVCPARSVFTTRLTQGFPTGCIRPDWIFWLLRRCCVPLPPCGLWKLTRRTAAAFEKAGLEQHFEVKAVAGDLLELLTVAEGLSKARDEKEYEKLSGKLEQLGQFRNRYYEKHRAEFERSPNAYAKLDKELEALARRCAETGKANETETETLRSFFECRQNIVRLLDSFAPVCDRLAGLAKKSLTGTAL